MSAAMQGFRVEAQTLNIVHAILADSEVHGLHSAVRLVQV